MKSLSFVLFYLTTLGLVPIIAQERYEANWSSLRKHNTPDWFDGLKFGMYFHWGWQSAALANGTPDMPSHEAIGLWDGEHFDAVAWVDLIEASGAQFAGPVAWHGSGLLHWNSRITEWNSVNKGPKVDIYGELAREIRRRDMKVISSFHTSSVWNVIWGPISKTNPTYLDPTADNSSYATSFKGRIGDEIFNGYFDRITEAIDTYQPDMVWFDTGFGGTVRTELRGYADKGRWLPNEINALHGVREKFQQKLISHYFNRSLEWKKEVEVIYKTFDIPPGIGIRDIENGNLPGLQYDPWMADINMAHHHHYPHIWFFNPKNPMKDANTLVDMLVDMTSKNGRMLLNVPPKPDGTFSIETVRELHAVGEWLRLNGEAIYDTLPWIFYGEGPTEISNVGHHAQGKNKGEDIPNYSAADIRFTQKGKTLYAIVLDWPGEEVLIRTLGIEGKYWPDDIKAVSLLGSDEDLAWNRTDEGMHVSMPRKRPCDFAYVLKIQR